MAWEGELQLSEIEASEFDLCVIGGGIAGLSAVDAYLEVYPEGRVLILEAQARIGGHDYTVKVNNPDDRTQGQFVDMGFMVFNERTYPNMLKLFEKYDIHAEDSEMTLSTVFSSGDVERQ